MCNKPDASEEEQLWHSFLSSRQLGDRDALIAFYQPFARMMAAKCFASRQVLEIEFDEYRQYALVGLVESIDRYDPSRGSSFRTFSGHRIRGAILNGIEKYCERQQQITARARLREERFEELIKEIATSQKDPFLRLVETAIGTAIGYMLENSGMYRNEDTGYEHNVYRSREMGDLARLLDSLVETLPEQQRLVVSYHYLQHMRFEEIARIMGVTKGRISQIHHKALARMREHYDQLQLLRTDY